MKISYQWLQEYIQEPLPEPKVLAEKIIFGAFEVENADELETLPSGDTMLDIKTLPDRNHDALGHYGMAKEVAGLLGLTLKPLTLKEHTSAQSDLRVTIKTDACRRYIARKVFGVTVKPSPDWLRERLETIGQRSINNVVDATNYVMFTLGQPIHAFDYDKLGDEAGAGHIIIRQAYDGEEMLTLDGKLVPLDETIAIITNEKLDQPLAVAGVKGGKIAEVDANTKTIVIEVANFDPIAVRKAAKKLNLQTDSSKRFENELSAHVAGIAIRMITDLITELAGGQPEDVSDEYPRVEYARTISFTADYINQKIGTNIPAGDMRTILDRYGYAYTETNGSFDLTVPFERVDMVGPHDIIEEIGRVYGYNHIEAKLASIEFAPKINSEFAAICAIKNDLLHKGYHEVMTYTFRKKGDYEVVRGPLGKSALRTNLVDGLTEALTLNKQNAALLGVDDMKIFEVGTVFKKDMGAGQDGTENRKEIMMVGVADKSGVIQMTLDEYIAKNGLAVEEYNLPEGNGNTNFKPWSEYPYMTRDIAVWIPESDDAQELVDIITKNGTDLLQGTPRLFDQFSKDGRTSYGYRMIFQSFERTLTDDEINGIMSGIHGQVKARGWEVR